MCKRPAKKAPVALSTQGSWRASVSFHWLKATYAAEKAYIQVRASLEKASKVTCLVNVGVPRGPRQTWIMEKLLRQAQEEPGLDKATLVAAKNALLAAEPDSTTTRSCCRTRSPRSPSTR